MSRSLQEDFGLSAEKAAYREAQVHRYFQETWVVGHEHLIPEMTNHPKDRHALASAVHAGTKLIVTYNIEDFPPSSLTPHSIVAQGLSAFLKGLYKQSPAEVMETREYQAAAIRQPLQYVLSKLRTNARAFVAMLDEIAGAIFRPDEK